MRLLDLITFRIAPCRLRLQLLPRSLTHTARRCSPSRSRSRVAIWMPHAASSLPQTSNIRATEGLRICSGSSRSSKATPTQQSQDFSAAIRHNPRLVSAYLNLSRIRMQTAATDMTARAEALRLSEKALLLDPPTTRQAIRSRRSCSGTKTIAVRCERLRHLSAQSDDQDWGTSALVRSLRRTRR